MSTLVERKRLNFDDTVHKLWIESIPTDDPLKIRPILENSRGSDEERIKEPDAYRPIKAGLLFDALSGIPRAEQADFWTKALSSINCPNARPLALELVRISYLKPFRPKGEVDREFVEAKVRETQKRFGVEQKELILLDNTWDEAEDAFYDYVPHRKRSSYGIRFKGGGNDAPVWGETLGETLDDLRTGLRVTYRRLISDLTLSAYHYAIHDSRTRKYIKSANAWTAIIDDTDFHTEWVLMQDIMARDPKYKEGNPWAPMIDLYEAGVWPIGQNSRGFAVFNPAKDVARKEEAKTLAQEVKSAPKNVRRARAQGKI